MTNFFKKLFGGAKKPEPASDDTYQIYIGQKEKGLEAVLGEMHGMVGHAIIPFDVGGTVDMYYFLHHIQGTGFATMELIAPDGTGPKPNQFGTYELLAFTRHPYSGDMGGPAPFNRIERRMCGIFTQIGNYSFSAVLKPGDTCELPRDEGENTCLILDEYRPGDKQFTIDGRSHHLMLCIELFRSEMEFSRQHGSEQLFKLLRAAGHYPYSDMDREAVV